MRIAAGILMIISGLCLPAINQNILEMTAKIMGVPIEVVIDETAGWVLLLFFLPLGLTVGGGISALRRKHWWWALCGAICSMLIGFTMLIFPVFGLIFPPMGILAIVFVCLRKREWES